jgi:hypothetical protein
VAPVNSGVRRRKKHVSICKFLTRGLAMTLLIAVAFTPIFWLYRWNFQVYQSRLLSAVIAGAFVGVGVTIYRLIVHPTAVQMDEQWKQRRSRRTDSDI